jgi:hypothetical protein
MARSKWIGTSAMAAETILSISSYVLITRIWIRWFVVNRTELQILTRVSPQRYDFPEKRSVDASVITGISSSNGPNRVVT